MSADIAGEQEQVPPWHEYDGCHGCRRGNALGERAVKRAIAIVEDSRSTHVEWAEWQESDPDWRSKVEPSSPGEPEHHRRCIADYDHVLSVLRAAETDAAVQS